MRADALIDQVLARVAGAAAPATTDATTLRLTAPKPAGLLRLTGDCPDQVADLVQGAGGATRADRLFVRDPDRRRFVARRYLEYLLLEGPCHGGEALLGWPGPPEDVLAACADLGVRPLLVGGLERGCTVWYTPTQEDRAQEMRSLGAQATEGIATCSRARVRKWWGED